MGVPLSKTADGSRREPIWPVFAQIVFVSVVATKFAPEAYARLGHPDFIAFWAAHRVTDPYNCRAITQAAGTPEMFPYPPTFLLLSAPLRWLSAFDGYRAWLALSLAALVAAVRRPVGIALIFAPAVFTAGFIGQTSLFVGALLFAATSMLSRPVVAGVLFGLAACVKPQVGVLIPLVLIGGRQWRVIVAAAVICCGVALLATTVYGVGIWCRWLGSLPVFLNVNDAQLASHYISLPGIWRAPALLIGAIFAYRAGRQGEPIIGVIVAVVGALLGSLHAMNYDQAILTPFALTAALERRWRGLPYFAFLASPLAVGATLALGLVGCLEILAHQKYVAARLRRFSLVGAHRRSSASVRSVFPSD
jgi:hypothetical protein